MKRARKAAIVESSASDEDSDDSDFGETLGAKLKRKKLEAEWGPPFFVKLVAFAPKTGHLGCH